MLSSSIFQTKQQVGITTKELLQDLHGSISCKYYYQTGSNDAF